MEKRIGYGTKNRHSNAGNTACRLHKEPNAHISKGGCNGKSPAGNTLKGILDPVHERYAHTGRFAAHDDRNPVCHGEDENNAQHFTGTGNKFANKFRFRNLVDGPQEQGTNKEDKGKFIKVPIAKFRIMTRAKQFTQDRDLGQAAERQIHHVLHGAAVSKLDGVPRHVPADKGQDNDHQQGDGPSFAARKFFHFVIFINKGLDIKTLVDEDHKMEEFTSRKAWSITLLVVIILALVCGYMPWDAIKFADGSTMKDVVNLPFRSLAKVPILGELFGAGHYTEFGDWYFDEFAFVFLVGALLLGPINKIPEPEFVREFVAGAREMLGVVLVLTVANGISVIMGSKTAGMSVTFVYWIQNALQGVPGWAFAIAAALAYVGIGFFMQSTSGVAGITMPILGAVAYALFQSAPIGSIGGQVMLIAAFTIGLNFTSAIYPSATNMGTLEIYQIPYDRYLSFMLKIDMVMLIVGIAIVSVAPMLGIL